MMTQYVYVILYLVVNGYTKELVGFQPLTKLFGLMVVRLILEYFEVCLMMLFTLQNSSPHSLLH